LGAALFAGLTIGAADTEGDISRTAGIGLTGKMNEFFKDKSGNYAPDVDTFGERIAKLLGDRTAAKTFLDKNTFEAGAMPAIQSLFMDPQSAARKTFESTMTSLGTAENQTAAGARAIAFMAGGKLAGVRRQEETVGSGMERYRLNQQSEFSTEKREEIVDLLSQVTLLPRFAQKMQLAGATRVDDVPTECVHVDATCWRHEGYNARGSPGTLEAGSKVGCAARLPAVDT
jgi:hypothetical protein